MLRSIRIEICTAEEVSDAGFKVKLSLKRSDRFILVILNSSTRSSGLGRFDGYRSLLLFFFFIYDIGSPAGEKGAGF